VKGLIVLGGPKLGQPLFFITILNMDFCNSELNAHKYLLTIYSTSPTYIFFGDQNKNFTTLK
jgi:hypothetical protein